MPQVIAIVIEPTQEVEVYRAGHKSEPFIVANELAIFPLKLSGNDHGLTLAIELMDPFQDESDYTERHKRVDRWPVTPYIAA